MVPKQSLQSTTTQQDHLPRHANNTNTHSLRIWTHKRRYWRTHRYINSGARWRTTDRSHSNPRIELYICIPQQQNTTKMRFFIVLAAIVATGSAQLIAGIANTGTSAVSRSEDVSDFGALLYPVSAIPFHLIIAFL